MADQIRETSPLPDKTVLTDVVQVLFRLSSSLGIQYSFKTLKITYCYFAQQCIEADYTTDQCFLMTDMMSNPAANFKLQLSPLFRSTMNHADR
jgi:hypothetical protein